MQFAALDAIHHRPGIDQAGLADAIGKDRATTGAVVDRLEQKGLVSRAINARDKRARELQITREGRTVLTALVPVVEQLQKEILPGLDEAEYRQFIALAAKATRAGSSQSGE